MLEKIVQKYPDVAVIIKTAAIQRRELRTGGAYCADHLARASAQFLALHEKLMQKRGYHTDDSIKQAQQKAGYASDAG